MVRGMPFAMTIGATKMLACDIVAQVSEQQQPSLAEIDWRRAGAFSLFGALQLGAANHLLFTRVVPRLFPAAQKFVALPWREKALAPWRGLGALAVQTLVWEASITPLVTFPAFYLVREMTLGAPGAPAERTARALHTCRENCVADNWQSLQIFLPFNFMNFLLVPPRLQAPFAATAGAVWAVLLSQSRGGGHNRLVAGAPCEGAGTVPVRSRLALAPRCDLPIAAAGLMTI